MPFIAAGHFHELSMSQDHLLPPYTIKTSCKWASHKWCFEVASLSLPYKDAPLGIYKQAMRFWLCGLLNLVLVAASSVSFTAYSPCTAKRTITFEGRRQKYILGVLVLTSSSLLLLRSRYWMWSRLNRHEGMDLSLLLLRLTVLNLHLQEWVNYHNRRRLVQYWSRDLQNLLLLARKELLKKSLLQWRVMKDAWSKDTLWAPSHERFLIVRSNIGQFAKHKGKSNSSKPLLSKQNTCRMCGAMCVQDVLNQSFQFQDQAFCSRWYYVLVFW